METTYSFVLERVYQDLDFFIHASIQKAADKLYVSLATMHRAVKSFGFDSYSDFRLFLQEVNEVQKNERLAKSKNSFEKLYSSYNTALTKTNQWVQKNKAIFEQIHTKCNQSEGIITFGIGASSFAAQNFANKTALLNKKAHYISDFYSMLKMVVSKNNNLYIIFSRSGISNEVYFLIKKMIAKKAAFVLVTDNNDHPEKTKIPFLISTSSINRKTRFTETSSKISQLFVSDLLFELIASDSKNDSAKVFVEFENAVKEWWEFKNESDLLRGE